MCRLRHAALAGLAATLFVIAVRPSPAAAHANLLRSEPPAGAVLESAPDHVVMTFTEQPELRASDIRVIRADGSVVLPDPKLALTDMVTLRFALPPLEDGTYTIAWRVVSAVDGHPSAGTIPFGVGPSASTIVPAPATVEVPGGPPRLLLATGKFVSYAAFSMLLLLAVILPLIVLPALAAANAGAGPGPRLAPAVRRGAAATLILLIATAGLALFLQAWANGGQASSFFSETTWTLLHSTRFGTTWIVRAAVSVAASTLLVAVLVRGYGSDGGQRRSPRLWRYAPIAAAALALPLTLSWNSHFAATDSRASVGALVDGAHAIAATLWLGGLLALAALALTSRRPERREHQDEVLHVAMRRFSVIAGPAVAVLLVSGMVAWWRVVGSVGDTISTGYGRLLLAKVALLLLMLALAALHFSHGHLPGIASRLGVARLASVRGTVALEAMLGICAIGAAGLLSATPPPADRTGGAGGGTALVEKAGDVEVRLTAEPLVAGQNVLIFELGGSGARDVVHMVIRLNYLDDELGMSDVDAVPDGAGRYVLQGSQLSLPGRWQLTAIMHRISPPEARATFEVMVAPR